MQIFNLRISNPETFFSAMNFHAKKFLYSSVMSIKGLVFLFLKFRFCQNPESSLSRSVDHIGRISINSDNFQQESWKVALSLLLGLLDFCISKQCSSKFNFCSRATTQSFYFLSIHFAICQGRRTRKFGKRRKCWPRESHPLFRHFQNRSV